jgi:hypothetical protein
MEWVGVGLNYNAARFGQGYMRVTTILRSSIEWLMVEKQKKYNFLIRK